MEVLLDTTEPSTEKNHGLQAELLMTVHHRNLVSFIGYCDDGNKMALIYEHMANGNLKNYLSGTPTTFNLYGIT